MKKKSRAMKEDFLHYLWKHQLFSERGLKTTAGKHVYVKNTGKHNDLEGPDFLNATIEIEGLVWFGHVEIHVKSSDWYLHNHQNDSNYHCVVLHVVWEDDVEVFDKGNEPLITLEISQFITKRVLENYERLFSKNAYWILCEPFISPMDDFFLNAWKTRLHVERLEDKSKLINTLLVASNSNYEAVLFVLLMKAFGSKINGDAFLELAQTVTFSLIMKERHDALRLNALLFGQAGFLDAQIEDAYYINLQREYHYLRHKHKIQGMPKKRFQLFKIRPSNFPTIRIAQICAMYHKYQNLFSQLMSFTRLEEFYKLFDVRLDAYWSTHYTFQKVSPRRVKKITKSFVDLIVINVIIPLKFNYLKRRNVAFDEEGFDLLRQIKSEKNAIVDKFSELGIASSSAFDSQALLQLKNNYCAKKRCLHCAIGMCILKKV